ncbi:MAG TPA: hypothetical protein VI895_11600 [Bdellovibrionota bacterium]|nr:hypothetical protein [Bdellovibrionota bacterium]
MNRWKRILASIFLVAGVLWGRAVHDSRSELRTGDEAYSKGGVEEAIVHWDRCAHWYAPGNPFVGRALDRLWNAGQSAEKSNPKMALLAYDAIRGSIYAIRHIYWPYRERLSRADDRIAELRAEEQVRQGKGVGFSRALEQHRKALQTDERPKTLWVLVAQVGFWGWIFAVVGLIFRGFDSEGRMQLRHSISWIGGIVLFFAAWVTGLLNA